MELIFKLLELLGVVTVWSLIVIIVMIASFIIVNLFKGFTKALKGDKK